MISLLAAAVISCVNPYVFDGDTIACSGTRVRLFGVNAPEIAHPQYGKALGEAGGPEAKYALSKATRRRVWCKLNGDRSYNRWVGSCYTFGPANRDPVDLQEWLLRNHLACEWLRYDHGYYRFTGAQICGPYGKFTYIGPSLAQLMSR